jgi:hypothetical protein
MHDNQTKSEPKVPSVEYRVELISASDEATIQGILNQHGAQGWALIALRQIGFARDLYIFRRGPAADVLPAEK